MPNSPLEILAYESTALGTLCLRRRKTLSEPRQWITEVTLNHEFLMSSLHTDSERGLAQISLDQVAGSDLRVLVGGLGLGYTAQAALGCPRVAEVVVIEFLPQVIEWLRAGLIPLSDELNAEARLSIVQDDVYQFLLSPPDSSLFDAVLIDVDHSPEDQLSSANARFYSVDGLSAASRHLRPGGVLGMWSYAEHSETLEAMRQVFADVAARPIAYFNQHVQEDFVDWVYTGRNAM